MLTVIANEAFLRFAQRLQQEITDKFLEEVKARYGKPIDELSDEERRAVEGELVRKDQAARKPFTPDQMAAKLRSRARSRTYRA